MTARPALLLFLVWLASAVVLPGCGDVPQVTNLRLDEVGPFTLTLTWTTDVAARFDVAYGEGEQLDRLVSQQRSTTAHRVTLTGLKPSTHYSYQLAKSQPVLWARTAPGRQGAFDLVVIDAQSPACRDRIAVAAPRPDLVVRTQACATGLAAEPMSLQVLDLPATGVRRLSVGNATLLLASDPSEVGELPADAQTVLIVLPAVPETVPPAWRGAVVVSPREAVFADARTDWGDAAAWIEVDAYEVAWVDRPRHERRVIVAAPPETRKTCLYCDRLLEAGRYEESIEWYQDFIAGNAERHEIEDAVFAIARILDEKLFRYENALTAYGDFLARYPDSRRVTLVRSRVEYLRSHTDHGYQPLERFERAKAGPVKSDPEPTINAVETMLRNFAHSTVAPEAMYWLGHQLEGDQPDRAIAYYRDLIRRNPKHEDAALAAMALGDIAYRAGAYRKAIAAYERADVIVSEKYRVALDDKVRKSRRNIKREIARYAAWGVLAAWLLATLVWRAAPAGRDLLAGVMALAAYVLAGGVYFALQFDQARPLLPALAVLAPAMSVLLAWNRTLARGRGGWWTIGHALTASLAAAYLVMYGFHQLYVFGL